MGNRKHHTFFFQVKERTINRDGGDKGDDKFLVLILSIPFRECIKTE
jgi:hypothetical protein